jgi:hypothetical protein
MYLALLTPWASHGTPPATGELGPEAPSDAGVGT